MSRFIAFVITNLVLCFSAHTQTVQWLNKSNSGTSFQSQYTIDDSNCVVHIFFQFSTVTTSVFGETIGPYPTTRNNGIVKVNPDGTTNWNLVFSGLTNSTSFNFRSITTDGLNYYLAYSSVDTLIVRKNNVITDTIVQGRSLLDFNLLKITNTGEIEWIRTVKGLGSFTVAIPAYLNYDVSTQTIRGGIGVWDSVLIDTDATNKLKYVSNRNIRISKCGPGIAASTFLFAYNKSGVLKKSRILTNDKIITSLVQSYQANMFFASACDTTTLDGTLIGDGDYNYLSLDSGLKFNLLARVPVKPYTAIRFTKGKIMSVGSRSESYTYLQTQIGDTLILENVSYGFKPYEIMTFDINNTLIKKRALFPFSLADSVRITYEYNLVDKEFVYIAGRGINLSKFNKSFTLDGISYNFIPNAQFSFFMKLDKLLNVLWINFNYLTNTTPPLYQNLAVDNEGNLIFNGSFNGQNTFPVLNDSLPRTGSLYSFVVKVRDQTITRGEVSKGPYCAGDSLLIPYSKTGIFDGGNQFIAQLSNEDGSFDDTSKIFELGRITSSENDTIIGKLPFFQVKSSPDYRIRIISTSPVVQSFYKLDSLKLLIYSRDKADPGPDVTICKGDSVELNTYGGTKWKWSPANLVVDSTKRTTKTAPISTTNYTIIISDSSGCGDADTAFKMVYVRNNPKAEIVNKDSAICLQSNLNLIASFSLGDSSKYQWKWYSVNKAKVWTSIDSGYNAYCDTILYTLPNAIKDSITIAVVLTDNCSPDIDTAWYTIKVNQDKPFAILNTYDTSICPSTSIDIEAKFYNGIIPNAYKWKWLQYVNSNIVYNDSFSGIDSTIYRIGLNKNFIGNKDVFLVLQNACSPISDTTHFTIRSRDKIQTDIVENDTVLCKGNALKLHANSSGGVSEQYQYSWLIGSVEISDSSSLEIVSDTSVAIQLIVRDNCMPESDTVYYNLTIREPLKISGIGSNDTTICLGNDINLTATVNGGLITNYTYDWILNGQSVSNTKDYIFESAKEYNANDTIARTYQLNVTVTDNCTVLPDSFQIDIVVLPGLKLSTFFTDSICFGNSDSLYAKAKGGNGTYQYKWLDENLQEVSQVSYLIRANTNANSLGNQKYSVVLEDGCTVKGDTMEIEQFYFSPLQIAIQSNDTCSNSNVQVTSVVTGGNTNSKTVKWFINGVFTAQNNGVLNFQNNTISNVKAVVEDGCSRVSDTVSIRISTLPKAEVIVSEREACMPVKIQYRIRKLDSTPFNYTLQFGNGKNIGNRNSNDSIIDYLYSIAGTYNSRVVMRNIYGCSDSMDLGIIQVNPLPRSDFSWNPNPVTLDDATVNFVNESGNASSYIWYLFNGDSSILVSPTYPVSDTGAYRIGLIAISDKNCKDTTYKTVLIRSNYRLFIPDAFSPNGDGFNDVWIPFSSGIEYLEFTIFNRWGEVVFKGNSKQAWDGFYQSEQAVQDVYIYQIKVKPQGKSILFLSGTFHLL